MRLLACITPLFNLVIVPYAPGIVVTVRPALSVSWQQLYLVELRLVKTFLQSHVFLD